MNAYNPLESMKRLETSGFDRRQAEAIASEIDAGTKEHVTNEYLDQRLDALTHKVTVKIGIMTAAIAGIATSILGLIIAIK